MKKIFLLLALLTTQSCFAIMESQKISLQEAIDSALLTNPQVKMAKLDVESSKNDIKSASRLQNPPIYAKHNMGKAREGNVQELGADYTIEILKRGRRKNNENT